MILNEVLEKLPKHLLSLVIDQPYNDYTAQDHAVWRYVMRQNLQYLSRVAHGSYVEGLRKTGISIDEIPHMYGMNRILKEIGWAAVAVDGFIPPAAFMEFQAYNVLVIAADIRPIDQIRYTPAPDIIHEAAGHAPIIADAVYATYLRDFGYVGHKAFSSKRDYQLYEAIRHLSILKADPYTKQEEIRQAEEHLSFLEMNRGQPSERARIRNLHLWTVEYGLIGSLDKPKIYGAGLLSSIGESVNALSDQVKKIPYSLQAAEVGFDITTMQPQLFVCSDFAQLTEVLTAFTATMALKRGGLYALEQAVNSGNTATIEFSSGLQVSGTVTSYQGDKDQPAYFQCQGPAQLSYRNQVLPGHTTQYHKDGYGTPVGFWTNTRQKPEELSESVLAELGMESGKPYSLQFQSGVRVEGRIRDFTFRDQKLLMITWEECQVRYKDKVLFRPEWGTFDMGVGSALDAGYTGPADTEAFGLTYEAPAEKTHKILHTNQAKQLHAYYATIRKMRLEGAAKGAVEEVWTAVRKDFPGEWLAPLELLELIHKDKTQLALQEDIRQHLSKMQESREDFSVLIRDGLLLLDQDASTSRLASA